MRRRENVGRNVDRIDKFDKEQSKNRKITNGEKST